MYHIFFQFPHIIVIYINDNLHIVGYNWLHIQHKLLPFTGLVRFWLVGLAWWLCLWFAPKVIDKATPYTPDTCNVPLARLQVLIHVVQHLVCPLQNLTLSHKLLWRQGQRESHI